MTTTRHVALQIEEALMTQRPHGFDDCVVWARHMYAFSLRQNLCIVAIVDARVVACQI
jgi:hypothetical protein